MARKLLEHEIFDLLGDSYVSELDFSNQKTNQQFELLHEFELWKDQKELDEPEYEISTNISFNLSENKIKFGKKFFFIHKK